MKDIDLDKLFEQTQDMDLSKMPEQIQIAIELLRLDKMAKDGEEDETD